MPKLRTIVDFSFLALSVVLIATLLSNSYDRQILQTQSLEIQNARKEFMEVMSKNLQYLEGRQNRSDDTQDRYQIGTDRRVNLLEQKVEKLEKDNKNTNRIINTITNNNTNIVNSEDRKSNNNK